MDLLSEFVYLRTYARFLWDLGRRETYRETVERYCDWAFQNPLIPGKVKNKTKEKMLNLEAMPSMRALWTAGGAADADNAVIYNCSFLNLDDQSAFGEALYLLMCGTGVGFSCEAKNVNKLPGVKHQKNAPVYQHTIRDSRGGWKSALDLGIDSWINGRDVYFDFSKLRAKGEPLYTMGGRSSGPEVLQDLMRFTRETILGAQGRFLTPLECHDIMCEIARIVVVGGTRRSALISLSDLNDDSLRQCKNFHLIDKLTDEEEKARQRVKQIRRYGANNSAVYYEKPDIFTFLDEWVSLGRSGTGERGIANIYGARRNSPKRRKSKLIEGLNPCAEVALRDREFCNLSEAIVRPDDDFESLRDKLTTATWLGVIQSTFTNFKHIPDKWKQNCEEERLCGVSITGQYDNPGLLTPEVLKLLKQHVINVTKKAAKILGINTPAAATSVKPSGTLSQVANCSAGLHPRWSPYYVRNIQIATTDPLFRLMRDQGAPHFLLHGKDGNTAVISFPVASPKGAVTRADLSAMDQLKWYEKITSNYTEHSASCTIYVANNEWLEVANWVYDNFDRVNGLSFFPKENGNHKYDYLPFEEISEDDYHKRLESFPEIDFSKLPDYESIDNTTGAKELACAGGACEI
jgi:ribonucleoside-diphosphate reductase alpha chain